MLIVTSKIKEKITIGDSISIEVLGIQGKRVRLGIKAPKEVIVQSDKDSKQSKKSE